MELVLSQFTSTTPDSLSPHWQRSLLLLRKNHTGHVSSPKHVVAAVVNSRRNSEAGIMASNAYGQLVHSVF
jgi:hypothetical protein